MRKTKKIILKALCCLTVFSNVSAVLPKNFLYSGTAVYAAEKIASAFEWEENDDGTYAITKCLTDAECVSIPSEINGTAVTALGQTAFSKNTTAKEIRIPASLTEISDLAMSICQNLETVTVDAENPVYSDIDGVLYDKAGETLLSYPRGRKSTEYTVLDGTKVIWNFAFIKNEMLETVMLPESVTTIRGAAFNKCTALQSVSPMTQITSVGLSAFASCPLGEEQDGIRYYADWAIGVSNEVKSSAESVEIREGTVGLCEQLFNNAEVLQKLTLPESLRYIGAMTIANCPKLEELHIPTGVTYFDEYTFVLNENLRDIWLPANSELLPENAFLGCEKLENIYLDGEKTDWKPEIGEVEKHSVTSDNYGVHNIVNPPISGDVNNDRLVSIADVVLLQRYLLGEEVESFTRNTADLDLNGVINVSDLTLIKQKLLRTISFNTKVIDYSTNISS